MIRPRTPRIVTAKRRHVPGVELVPVQYKIRHPFRYPIDNSIDFERWYYESYRPEEERSRVYLPVLWTSYHCAHKFGKDLRAINDLQRYIDGLDRNKKYYTICQYDDGPDINGTIQLEGLDIKVFGMAGGRNDFPIPLLCQPHGFTQQPKKDLLSSFVGRITHNQRGTMIKALEGKDGHYISTKSHNMTEYCSIMARSVFALCPRGYGPTSFRIMEAVQTGAIPVYISDHFVLPYNRPFDYGLLVEPEKDVCQVLSDIPKPMITVLQQNLDRVKPLFTYHGCKAKILEELRNEEI